VREAPPGGDDAEPPGERLIDQVWELRTDRDGDRRRPPRRDPIAEPDRERQVKVPDREVTPRKHVSGWPCGWLEDTGFPSGRRCSWEHALTVRAVLFPKLHIGWT